MGFPLRIAHVAPGNRPEARAAAWAAAAALGLAACGGSAPRSWLQLPAYASPIAVAPGQSVGIGIGARGEAVGPLLIAVEGGDGGPVPPPLVVAIPPVLGFGDCEVAVLASDPPAALVKEMCADLWYLRAVITAAQNAAPGDVPLRIRVDYVEYNFGLATLKRAVAPFTVSIAQP